MRPCPAPRFLSQKLLHWVLHPHLSDELLRGAAPKMLEKSWEGNPSCCIHCSGRGVVAEDLWFSEDATPDHGNARTGYNTLVVAVHGNVMHALPTSNCSTGFISLLFLRRRVSILALLISLLTLTMGSSRSILGFLSLAMEPTPKELLDLCVICNTLLIRDAAMNMQCRTFCTADFRPLTSFCTAGLPWHRKRTSTIKDRATEEDELPGASRFSIQGGEARGRHQRGSSQVRTASG